MHKPDYNVLTLYTRKELKISCGNSELVKFNLQKCEVKSHLISLASAGENNGFYGGKHSEESKAKQRVATLAKGPLRISSRGKRRPKLTTSNSVYISLTAKALGCTRKVLDSHVGKVYRDRYIITIFRTP
jgi:hypothetical protein